MTFKATNSLIKSFLFLYFFLGLVSQKSIAQSTITSLLNSIQELEIGKQYVDTLNELSYQYFRVEPDKTADYAQSALLIADSLNYQKGIADANMRLGMLERSYGNFTSALGHYKIALAIRKKIAPKNEIANVYNNIGLCAIDQNNIPTAIENFQKGLTLLKKESPSSIKGKLHLGLADLYIYNGEYKKALSALDSSQIILSSIKDISGVARLLSIKGALYFDLKNINMAKENISESLKQYTKLGDDNGIAACYLGLGNVSYDSKDYVKAQMLYQKALALEKSLNFSDLGNIYYNLGSIYHAIGDTTKSKIYYLKSQAIFSDLNQIWQLADVNYELGNISYDQSNYSSAKDYYLKSLNYAIEDFDPFVKANTYYNLSETYAKLQKMDSAFLYSQLHIDLRDSIYFNRVDAINFQSNLAESKRENTELQLTLSENQRQRLWLNAVIVVSLLAILLLIATVMYFKNKQKRTEVEYNLFLAEKETESANRKVDELLQNQELQMAYARLEAKDQTQKKIGEFLHDQIGVTLSTIKLYFKEFTEQLNKLAIDTSKKQFKAVELLDEAVKEVRKISHDMQSGVLQKLGLVEAVKSLANTIQDSGQLEVEVKIHGFNQKLPNSLEVKIYKIIQESVANVLKHSKANKLTLYLHRQDELVNIIVEDNGIGFKPNQVVDNTGMGLKNIAYRVAELNGTCYFDSEISRGTSVVIDLPLKTI